MVELWASGFARDLDGQGSAAYRVDVATQEEDAMKTQISKRLIAIGALAALTVGGGGLVESAASAATRRTVRKASSIPANFDIRFVQDAQAVTAGEMATYTFDVVPTSTFNGAIVFDLPNLTDKFTGRVSTETTTRVKLEISAPPFANTNSGVFILRGRSGTIVQQAVFRLNVNARPVPVTTVPPVTPSSTVAPQFTITSSDPPRIAAPGDTLQYGVNVNRTGGFTGAVDLRVDGLPKGTAANFAPNPTVAGSVLYVTPSGSTPSGTYLLSIVGLAGSTTRAAAVQMIVRRTGDFTLSLAPTSVSVPVGNDAVAAINVSPRVGSTSLIPPDVTFTASGVPAGLVVLFDPNPSNGLTTVRVRVPVGMSLGTKKLTITGSSGVVAQSLTLTVVVLKSTTGGFGLSASPPSATVTPGAEVNYSLTIVPAGGFDSPIDLVVKNLPPFATATIVGQTAKAATVKITTSTGPAGTTPTGTFPLQITGTSGSLSSTVQVNLVVGT